MPVHVLKTPVNITLRRLAHGSDAMSATWNLSLVGGRGGWQSDGCRVLGHYDNFTTISCSSLGSYGLLMVGGAHRGRQARTCCGRSKSALRLCPAGPQQRGVLLSRRAAAAPGHLRRRCGAAALPRRHHGHLHVPSQASLGSAVHPLPTSSSNNPVCIRDSRSVRVSCKFWHMLVNLCFHVSLTAGVFAGGINQTRLASVCQAVSEMLLCSGDVEGL